MRRVLHVGPCDSPGGMATVMRTLADHPPEGWEATLLSSHSDGSLWAKWRAYRKAHRELSRQCTNDSERPNVVHIHVAADWSWRRKVRLVNVAKQHGVSVVVHLHSGRFDAWLDAGGARRVETVRTTLTSAGIQPVVLSEVWRQRLESRIGPLIAIVNPLPPSSVHSAHARDEHHLLLLGRSDPVKGHAFAIEVAERLRQTHPSLRLTMTGWGEENRPWINSPGWVSNEQKASLLARASVLLVPSAYEGQPMVALEALSAGLPVCVSDRVVGLPDAVACAPHDDVEAWVSTLAALLERPESTGELADSVASHAVDEVQQKWAQVYDSL